MRRALWVIGICVTLVGALVIWLTQFDPFGAEAAAKTRAEAVQRYVARLDGQACARAADVEAAARAENWPADPMDELWFCHAPRAAGGWMRVTVSPPLPFSTPDENAIFEAFDAQGCRQAWRYTGC